MSVVPREGLIVVDDFAVGLKVAPQMRGPVYIRKGTG